MYIVLPILGMSALIYIFSKMLNLSMENFKFGNYHNGLEGLYIRIPQWIYMGIAIYLMFTHFEYGIGMCFGMLYYLLVTQVISAIRCLALKSYFTTPALIYAVYMYVMDIHWPMLAIMSMWLVYSICTTLAGNYVPFYVRVVKSTDPLNPKIYIKESEYNAYTHFLMTGYWNGVKYDNSRALEEWYSNDKLSAKDLENVVPDLDD